MKSMFFYVNQSLFLILIIHLNFLKLSDMTFFKIIMFNNKIQNTFLLLKIIINLIIFLLYKNELLSLKI